MEGQFNPVLEFNMELELIEVDNDGMKPGFFGHLFISLYLVEMKGDFKGPKTTEENVTVRTVPKHTMCLK